MVQLRAWTYIEQDHYRSVNTEGYIITIDAFNSVVWKPTQSHLVKQCLNMECVTLVTVLLVGVTLGLATLNVARVEDHVSNV